MTVLVTGGLGFIGSKVVLQLLKKDIDVLVTDLDVVCLLYTSDAADE